MKKLLCVFVLFVWSYSVLANQNEEFRATWVVTWEWARASGSVEEQKTRIREILDNHQQANMNAVIWQVRQGGTSYYPSSYEPWGEYIGYQDPGFDPIAYAIQEAHARGLEFHAWINTFESRKSVEGTPVSEHPEWICRDGNGNPMPAKFSISPGLSEVRYYLNSVAMEIVRNYDIDGLHLDYVRWSEFTTSDLTKQMAKLAAKQHYFDGMISEEQIRELETTSQVNRYLYDVAHPYDDGVPDGFGSWAQWWRWSVTEFVRVLQDSIKSVKSWVRLSPAALGKYNWGGWNGYDVVYQDAALWFNEGYIDQLIGMHYHWTSASGFYGMLTGDCPYCWRQYIQPGIDAGRLFTVGPGSYFLAEDNRWGSHKSIVNKCREILWVDGFQFFSYGSWEDYQYWPEAGETFFDHKTKIRATKSIVDETPNAPTLLLTSIDSLHYQIEVTPATTLSSDHWFIIYRSQDDDLSINNDEIIDLHFGIDPYSFEDQFSGLQDYIGTYYYFATVLDRYWNESNASNAMQSDPIPSFAPTIVSTKPAEGDTIPVNTSLHIKFSKTMDIYSAQDAISIVPAVEISHLSWFDDHKSLSVVLENNFDFNSEYTITVHPSLTDVNGKSLDGNGDGIAGDPYEYQLITKSMDVDGPTILSSNPSYQVLENQFDVEDIITVLFNEVVDPTTLNDTTLILKQGNEKIEIAHNLLTMNKKTILNVQSAQPLENDTDYSLLVSQAITDTLGNQMEGDLLIPFRTSKKYYTEFMYIDKFLSTSDWADPGYSGSTTGIYEPNTSFGMTAKAYLPAVPVRKRSSAALKYECDTSASKFLLREYLSGSEPRSIFFDTTYVLQCHIFGDGSGNMFRFCVDDSTKDQAAFHEVSKWITIDWYGWRLVEWQLNDPNTVGEWVTVGSNGVLDGPSMRYDSFQLTHVPGAAVTGKIFFDNLRLVKKSSVPVFVDAPNQHIPSDFVLNQNYPNPFNSETAITFDLPESGLVELVVYGINGRKVATLIHGKMSPGKHEVLFKGEQLSSGMYIYRLKFRRQIFTGRMLLLK